MSEMWWYIIIERSYRMAVMAIGYGTQTNAWDFANTLYTNYSDLIHDYDVLYFGTKREMLEFILKDAKNERGV